MSSKSLEESVVSGNRGPRLDSPAPALPGQDSKGLGEKPRWG